MALPEGFHRPELMAIGDSLYQGVSSLTHRADYFARSAPAQVAAALGIADFRLPDPPQPVLVNLPDWLEGEVGWSRIQRELRASGRLWMTRPGSASGRPMFDNVAISGATIGEMLDRTAGQCDAEITRLTDGQADPFTDFDRLPDLLLAFIGRFTLNPSGAEAPPDWEHWSQMDWVRQRKPRRLIVNIGANDGLYNMCFEANRAGVIDTTRFDDFAYALKTLPAEVEHIYVNTLALPRTVCNLMPIFPERSEGADTHYTMVRPGPDAYFPLYENRMGFGYNRLTGDDVAALDAIVTEANVRLTDLLCAADDRVRMVDVTSLLKDYDHKHVDLAQGAQVVDLGRHRDKLSNVMLEVEPFTGAFHTGGLFSLDGMHLTTPGYALMARRVVETMQATESDLTVGEMPDPVACAADDPLLTRLPKLWALALWALRDYRRGLRPPGSGAPSAPPPMPKAGDPGVSAKEEGPAQVAYTVACAASRTMART